MVKIEYELRLYKELSFRIFSTKDLDPGHYLSFRSSGRELQTQMRHSLKPAIQSLAGLKKWKIN